MELIADCESVQRSRCFGGAARPRAFGHSASLSRARPCPVLRLASSPTSSSGRDVLLGAARNIVRGRVFDELFLMSIATLGAIAIGRYEEAVGVMAFYKIGEALQEAASEKSRASVAPLLALRPSVVRLRRGRRLGPRRSRPRPRPGDEFMVMAGERVALDGEVIEGECFVDASALTGESLPRRVAARARRSSRAAWPLDGSFTALAR